MRKVDTKLQWAIKVLETLLGNDAFRYLSTWSILCASSVNFLIPSAPNSMLFRRYGLCSLRNRKINIVWGKGGKCVQDARKPNLTSKCRYWSLVKAEENAPSTLQVIPRTSPD